MVECWNDIVWGFGADGTAPLRGVAERELEDVWEWLFTKGGGWRLSRVVSLSFVDVR